MDTVAPVPRAYFEYYLEEYGPLIVIPDIHAIPNIPNTGAGALAEAHTVISAIMVHHDKIVGSINLISKDKPYNPSDEEIMFIQALTAQATIAITNARLFLQVSESQKRLLSLSQRLVEIQESERRNLSRELHDEIGQILTS